MRALIVSCLLAVACDSSMSMPPATDMQQQATDAMAIVDGRFVIPIDMTALPVVEYIDCDMGSPPFLRIDGGFCVVCFAPNRPCCAKAPKCSSDTTCNDAGPLNWCQ